MVQLTTLLMKDFACLVAIAALLQLTDAASDNYSKSLLKQWW